jgi:phage terminase large subunit-like protein
MLDERDVMRGLAYELNRRLRPSWTPLPHQVPPPGRWRGWALLGGRGCGKTDACTAYVNAHALGPPCLNGPAPHWIGIIAPTLGDAVTSCVNGPAGIIAHNPTARLVSSPGGMIVRWPNGAEAKLFGASSPDDVERLRSGGNRCLVMAEELAAWRHLDDAWAHMKFGLRAGPHPHWVGATTPKPRQLIKKLHKGEMRDVVVTHATTNENPHLLLDVREELFDAYGGTALGAQELEGRIIDQDPNALWRREHIELGRVVEPPHLKKITVGVDPSGGAGEQGIVVVGRADMSTIIPGIDGSRLRPHGFVLADRTCHLSPNGWGREAVVAALDFEADDIAVEVNYGGEMAVSVVRGAAEALGIPISIKQVRASRGKRVRAEPVAALSEPDRRQWHHVGIFEELEDQLATWTPDLDWSPDRLDAMVWPAWHMALVGTRRTGVRGTFAGREAAATVLDAS